MVCSSSPCTGLGPNSFDCVWRRIETQLDPCETWWTKMTWTQITTKSSGPSVNLAWSCWVCKHFLECWLHTVAAWEANLAWERLCIARMEIAVSRFKGLSHMESMNLARVLHVCSSRTVTWRKDALFNWWIFHDFSRENVDSSQTRLPSAAWGHDFDDLRLLHQRRRVSLLPWCPQEGHDASSHPEINSRSLEEPVVWFPCWWKPPREMEPISLSPRVCAEAHIKHFGSAAKWSVGLFLGIVSWKFGALHYLWYLCHLVSMVFPGQKLVTFKIYSFCDLASSNVPTFATMCSTISQRADSAHDGVTLF